MTTAAPAERAKTLADATPALVRPKLRTLLHRHPEARAVAIAAGRWVGDAVVEVDDRSVDVVWCPSPLTVREALRSAASGCTLIVTPCDQADLGADVLARLERHQLLPLDRWQVLEDLFEVHGVEPRVIKAPGLVDALIDLVPADGYPPVASGLLDLDSAWRTVLRTVLSIDDPSDLVQLLLAAHNRGAHASWAAVPEDVRSGLVTWLRDTEGVAAAAVVAGLSRHADQGASPISVGLVGGVVLAEPRSGWDDAMDDRVLARAAVLLESRTGGLGRGDLAAQLWADAAAEAVDRLQMAAEPLLAEAEALLTEIGAIDAAGRSDLLPAGYRQRLERCAIELERFLEASSPAARTEALRALDQAVDLLAGHRLALSGRSEVRLEALRMAVRLARRLDDPPEEVRSFAESAQLYLTDGGWADLAYARAWIGETDERLATAYGRLLDRVADQRDSESRRFAELLVDWTASGGGAAMLLPIEDVLTEVVAPLAATGQNVAILVLDGMGVAAAAELFPDLVAHGWTEIVPAGQRQRPVIAAFPTLTRYCRTSLFAGELVDGTQRTEVTRFAAHPALVEASSPTNPPVLFHKADIEGPAGWRFDDKLTAALADEARRVVGVVVNAIDDHLAKGEQIAVRWKVNSIGPLHGLLGLAASSQRAVVVVADHGHVLERNMVLRRADGGERWHTPEAAPAQDDEVQLTGPRVLANGGTIVAPWTDGVRYRPKKHGYHGGASPAEVVVPLGVFTMAEVPDWDEVGSRTPAWWDAPPDQPAVPAAPTPRPTRSRRRPSSSSGEEQLFQTDVGRSPKGSPATSVVPASAEAGPVGGAWIEALLSSERYRTQEERAGRLPLPRERVAKVLASLETRGGTMTLVALARSAGIPPSRMDGVVAGLARLLNVEGFPVVTVEDQSISLDVALLRQQFAIG